MTKIDSQKAKQMLNLDTILACEPAVKFQQLRKAKLHFKFERFAYRSFTKNEKLRLEVIYDFSIASLFSFCPSFSIEINKTDKVLAKLNDRTNLESLIMHIGLMESLSYWKSFCPYYYDLTIAQFPKEALETWRNWYFNGLGEMLYRNNINCTESELVEFLNKQEAVQSASHQEFFGETLAQLKELQQSTASFDELINDSFQVVEKVAQACLPISASCENAAASAVLIPVGGGKDSVVTLELLRNSGLTRYGFTINASQASMDCLNLSQIEDAHWVSIKRNLDRRIVNLNKLGCLNGHTPFSGIVAFYAYLVAYLLDIPYIALSNEASSDSATVAGSNINHQYSKTSLFEQSFQNYTKAYLGNFAYYFSFLRLFNEIAIARLFSKFPMYFQVFRSCNLGSRNMENKWCGNCAKCLFVYIVLSLYIKKDDLISIFNCDLMDNSDLEADLSGLLAVTPVKPFECVGTVNEVSYVVAQLLNSKDSQKPYLLRQAEKWVQANQCPYIKSKDGNYIYIGANPLDLQEAKLIPLKFKRIIEKKIKEVLDK